MQPTLSPQDDEELDNPVDDHDALGEEDNAPYSDLPRSHQPASSRFQDDAQRGLDDIPVQDPAHRSNRPGDGTARASDGSPLPGGPASEVSSTKKGGVSDEDGPEGEEGEKPKPKTSAYKKYKRYKLAKNTAKAMLGSRRAIFGLIFSGSIIGLLIGGFFLLAPFKLMFMKENIDQVRMARMYYILDRRSDRFLVTMLKAEIAGEDAGGQNRYFIAKGWVGSENPFTQWYKDMRTDKFFEQMERTQGVRFIREKPAGGGKDRLVKLNVRGEIIDFSAITNDGGMVFEDTERFERLVDTRYASNKEARRAWNGAVKDATKRHQIIMRYTMRKWGRERLGITKWRFFENTREKADDKVRATWNKSVRKAAISGKAIRCLFDVGPCPDSDSLNDSDNATGAPDPEFEQAANEADAEAEQDSTPENPNDPSKSTRLFAKKIVLKLIPFVNIAEIIDLAMHVDKMFEEKKLSKMVAAYRAAEYASAYFTFSTLTDNLKAGKDVSGPEAGAALAMFNGMENSDGYLQVTKNSSSTAFLPSLNKAYAADSNPIDRVDDSFRVNGSSNASKFEALYEKTVGKILRPILRECDGLINFCTIASKISGVIGSVIETILKPLVAVAAPVGGFLFSAVAGQSPQEAMQGVMADATVFMAGSSKCSTKSVKEQEKTGRGGGRLFNCVDGGASVITEAVTQNMGGGPATTVTINELNANIAQAKREEDTGRSLWDKIASLERGDSLVAKLIMRGPSSGKELAANFQGMLAYINPVNLLDAGGASIVALSSQPSYADILDDNMYGVARYAVSEEDLAKEPYGSKSKAECDKEMAEYKTAMEAGGSPPTSMCTLDSEVANSLACLNSEDPDCARVGEQAMTPCLAEQSTVTSLTGQAPVDAPGQNRKIVLIGDSLLTGADETGDLGGRLEAKGFNGVDIVIEASNGRSITGAGTSGSRLSGEEAVEQLGEPGGAIDGASVVVVELGTNTSGTPAQFKAQVRKLVESIKNADKESDALIYWVSIVSKKDARYAAYNEAIEEVAESENISVITPKDISLNADKIHPTPEGYKKYAQAIAGAVDADGLGDAAKPDCGNPDDAVIAGDAQEIAGKLKELMGGSSPKVLGDSRYLKQITNIADGKAGCNVDEAILKLIYGMTTKGYQVSISSLNRFCTKVLTASGEGSNHYRNGGGHAVDFQAVNGQAVNGGSALSIKFIKDMEDFMLDGTELGQVNCRSEQLSFSKKVSQVNDSCNHIHVGFERGAE